MPKETRTKVIQIRLTPEERAQVLEIASLQGTTVSELFRQQVFKKPPARSAATISKRTLIYLGQIKTNIKAIAQTIAAATDPNIEPLNTSIVLTTLLETLAALQQTRSALITSGRGQPISTTKYNTYEADPAGK